MRVSAAQLEAIQAILQRHPEGATLSDVAAELPRPLDARTLQNWLNLMVEGGGARVSDAQNLPRYHAIEAGENDPEAPRQSAGEAGRKTGANSGNAAPPVTGGGPIGVHAQAPSSGPGGDPDFAPMFDLAMPTIVGSGMAMNMAMVALQGQAMRNQKVGPAMKAYLDYAKGRLANLSAADAEASGLLAEQYAAWRRRYLPPTLPVDSDVP